MNSHKIVPPSLSAQRGAKYPDADSLIKQVNKFTEHVCVINAYHLAEEAGDLRTQNVVLLGALFAIPDFPLTVESFKKALSVRFKGKQAIIDMNLKAFQLGFDKMKDYLK
jgi:indolepyruvate ferredoxin oxidoreductase beta subunit